VVNLRSLLFAAAARFRHRRLLAQVTELEPRVQNLSEAELRAASLALRHRARSKERPQKLLVEAFALVREAARRTISMRHFDVQLLGGMTLCERGLAEMQTGEGKTLTATLPGYVYALYGRGAHVSTVNDYLARRDAELMTPVYEALGMKVGVIESSTEPEDRRRAYAADVTYGTGKEFGFDFLRDKILLRGRERKGSNLGKRLLGVADAVEQPLQRPPFFMLVDEADSVLVDDAGTPLIISSAPGEVAKHVTAKYRLAAQCTQHFSEGPDFTLEPRTRRVDLTFAGREKARQFRNTDDLRSLGMVRWYEVVERALMVDRFYLRDRNYVVREDEVEIVDEFTGRVAEGRKWRNGVHQAVEAKEGLDVSDDTGQAARITVQDFFLRYRHLAGMSGTAMASAAEMRRIYKLRVRAIPTNRPPIRKRLPTRILPTVDAKLAAIVREVAELHALGRPVLIGTRSIDKSEQVSRLLLAAALDHDVLNAHEEEREAEIVARAGQVGRITVATNMAGRGTDIRLGSGVAELGGLYVIITEMHESARIDRQLIGRSGRQGDPGSYRFFLSLEDDLLREGLGPQPAARLVARYAPSGSDSSGSELSVAKPSGGESVGEESPAASSPATSSPTTSSLAPRLERRFLKAQSRVERRKYVQRKNLLTFEKRRSEMAKPLGLDPCLDLPG
jgi:preprotein translocase subunit SecA